MAWLWLVVVLLMFQVLNVVGINEQWIGQNWKWLGIEIPFTNVATMLTIYVAIWEIGYWLLRTLEMSLDIDLIEWLDRKLPWLQLGTRWIYATRPYVTKSLASLLGTGIVKLSRWYIEMGIIVGGAIVALPMIAPEVFPLLSGWLADLGIPWLAGIGEWLMGEGESWLMEQGMQLLKNVVIHVMHWKVFADLFVITVLVNLASRAFDLEQGERFYRQKLRKRFVLR